MLDDVLRLAARGFHVFPIHYPTFFRNLTVCSCKDGGQCTQIAKHPLVRWSKEATCNTDVISEWWHRWPSANVGIACGPSGLVVVDADDLTELKAWSAGRLPKTLTAASGRAGGGLHLYYRAGVDGLLPSYNKGKINIKSKGGYVVAPPSLHASGRRYAWVSDSQASDGFGVAIADLPAWVAEWRASLGTSKPPGAAASALPAPSLDSRFGALPVWAEDGRAGELETVWTREELPEIATALRLIPANCGYDDWYRIGAACHDFHPGQIGLELFKRWSALSEKHKEDVEHGTCERKWVEYEKNAHKQNGITKASIYFASAKFRTVQGVEIANGVSDASSGLLDGLGGGPSDASDHHGGASELNGHHVALPAALTGAGDPPKRVIWVDLDDHGKPRPTTTNAGLAIAYLGIACRKDVFHEKLLVGGQIIERWAGALSDEVVLMLRKAIKRAYHFDPGDNNTRAAAVQLCLEHQFNPVVDYLDALQWDGAARIGSWASNYLGARNDALVGAIGRLWLIAAVRRARVPGTKFDQIIVLEGREGTMKSSAIRVLAGDENFSDQNVLAASDKEQQEALTGVWLHEIAELAGMRRAEVERVKQFASRTEDRARPAYGRLRVDRPRTAVLVATTNEKTYLQSDTGNRRFWPIETGRIDIEGLARDRDQLWAEAAHIESKGESLVLDPKLWGDASEAQDLRRVVDEWEYKIARLLLDKDETSILDLLEGPGFLMRASEIGQTEQNRAARILTKINFERYQKRTGTLREWRYRRKKP